MRAFTLTSDRTTAANSGSLQTGGPASFAATGDGSALGYAIGRANPTPTAASLMSERERRQVAGFSGAEPEPGQVSENRGCQEHAALEC